MDELIAAAAKAKGLPESMVKRSAAARAKAEGKPIEAVLAEWAGVEVPTGIAAASSEAAPAPVAAAPSPSAGAGSALQVEESGEEAPPAAAPVRAERVLAEVVPTGAIPRWLAAMFVAVPLFALSYLGFFPNGPNCGDAGRLGLDPVTGEMVNCDGSAIGGGEQVDYYAMGETIYPRFCAACHGAGGGGQASFPAFTGGALLATFPEGQCSVQQEWIALGTAQWPSPTYGATGKPVGGSGAVMPSFGTQLDAEQIAAIALYERVAFGGEDLEAAKADCFPGEAAASEG